MHESIYSWKCPKCGTRPEKVSPLGDNKIVFTCPNNDCNVQEVTVEF